ncbi:MAG: ATP synthase F1 subunit gamma [bacterium]|nr:ATP synthase F1 subunit gamma [bacterium]MDY2830221.1 ATP synthase F1 subunit gamma [Alphaproteobacteria bacterium]
MAGLKELRTRISSITSTQKITSAMKMVAAARLKRAQDMLQKSRSYSEDLLKVTGRLLKEMRQEEKDKKITYLLPPVMRTPLKTQVYQLVVFSSDKGLCGSYNANVLKESLRRVNELLAEGKQVKVLSLGKKAGEGLKRRCAGIEVEILDGFAAKGPDYDETESFVNRLLDGYGKDFDVCEVVYTHFNSAINREVKTEQFLPVSIDTADERFDNKVGDAYYGYEENKQAVLFDVMPFFVVNMMFQKLLHSQTSEHGARMTSMDNATRNAKDMIGRLTLRYNRLRQSAITTELIEIISGAEAL